MRLALFVVLFAAFGEASSQSGVLVSPLPGDVDGARALEAARQVLTARGWTLVPTDRGSIDARKENSGMRVFANERALRFSDLSVRPRGAKQRDHREEGAPLAAVPQAEIDAIRVDLAAAFEGKLSLPSVAAPKARGQVLVSVHADTDPQEVMKAAREAFVGRRWQVMDEADGAFVADIRGSQESATLRVFVADGALRYIDRSTDRYGARAKVPERWLNNLRADLRPVLASLTPREERRLSATKQSDAGERLRQLKALLDRGLITQAEYDAKRAEILKGL